MRTLERCRLAAVLCVAAAVVLVAGACSGGDDNGDDATEIGDQTVAPGFMGATINPPMPKPDFTLTDTSGEPFDIVDDTEGYVTLLYLGYTHCPDICPTHMLEIAETLKAMDPADVEKVKVLFITTDPSRDTPEIIRQWLDLFDSRFIGLTADQATLDQLQISMGMNPAQGATPDASGGYEVSHAAYVLAFGTDDIAHLAYPGGMGREVWLNDLPKLVREGFKES